MYFIIQNMPWVLRKKIYQLKLNIHIPTIHLDIYTTHYFAILFFL